MSEFIPAFLEASKEFGEATQKVEEAVKRIQDAAELLKRWKGLFVDPTEHGYPATITVGETPRLDLTDWPKADELDGMLTAWHNANLALTRAWSAIPQDERYGLRSPEDQAK